MNTTTVFQNSAAQFINSGIRFFDDLISDVFGDSDEDKMKAAQEKIKNGDEEGLSEAINALGSELKEREEQKKEEDEA